MAATNAQVQQWSNERTRPRCEQIRHLLLAMEDDNASIDDVYANLTDNPDWTDSRTDAPSHLLTPSNLLAINAFSDNLAKIIRGDLAGENDATKAAAVDAVANQLAIVFDACVRPQGANVGT